MQIQAAAISLQGTHFVIVAANMDLIQSSGEADMTIEELQPKFGGVAVVLMAQRDNGTPVYYGDSTIVEMLADVPVHQMPWQQYSV